MSCEFSADAKSCQRPAAFREEVLDPLLEVVGDGLGLKLDTPYTIINTRCVGEGQAPHRDHLKMVKSGQLLDTPSPLWISIIGGLPVVIVH